MRLSYILLACLMVMILEKAEPDGQFFNRTDITQSVLFKAGAIPQPANGYKFHKIKNVHYNSFMNIQGGVMNCLPMQYAGFNAQWQIIPVPGSSFVKLRNRWNGYFA